MSRYLDEKGNKNHKRSHVGQIIEWGAHAALIITIILVGIQLSEDMIFTKSHQQASEYLTTGNVISPMKPYVLENGVPTILFALMPNCPYSLQSMPFYRDLQRIRNASNQTMRFVGAIDISSNLKLQKKVLRRNNVRLDSLIKLPFSDAGIHAGIHAIPSIILLDSSARIQNVWRGALSEKQEESVLLALGLRSTSDESTQDPL
ncbi:MAG: hypothetical protein OXE92_07225 [Bacteroidetes bacterium]|nr:hypothetical protein [Bacteroidota bacterium]MCY4205497.1 hypothetical protein [Bacteroidota bacterium]